MAIAISGYVNIFNELDLQNYMTREGEDLPTAQKKMLSKMLEVGPTRYSIKSANLNGLDEVSRRCPNFSEVTDTLKRYQQLAIESEERISFPPILLLGDAGVGKTHFSLELGKALALDTHVIGMGTVSAGWTLSGTGHSWQGAKAGRVVRSLLEGAIANPILMLDEIDKSHTSSNHVEPLAPMYQLLESDTAKIFKDEFLDFPVDCSMINWVCTANYVERIPKPILSRMRVFEVPKPTCEHVRSMAQSVYEDLLKEHLWQAEPALREDVLDVLGSSDPRTIKKALWEGLGASKLQHKDYIDADILKSILGLNSTKEKAPIGFLQG